MMSDFDGVESATIDYISVIDLRINFISWALIFKNQS